MHRTQQSAGTIKKERTNQIFKGILLTAGLYNSRYSSVQTIGQAQPEMTLIYWNLTFKLKSIHCLLLRLEGYSDCHPWQEKAKSDPFHMPKGSLLANRRNEKLIIHLNEQEKRKDKSSNHAHCRVTRSVNQGRKQRLLLPRHPSTGWGLSRLPTSEEMPVYKTIWAAAMTHYFTPLMRLINLTMVNKNSASWLVVQRLYEDANEWLYYYTARASIICEVGSTFYDRVYWESWLGYAYSLWYVTTAVFHKILHYYYHEYYYFHFTPGNVSLEVPLNIETSKVKQRPILDSQFPLLARSLLGHGQSLL